jgi:hypothetical protein
MTLGGPGPIVGHAVGKALGHDQEAVVDASEARTARDAIDTAELRDAEQLEYYGASAEEPAASPATGIRGLLHRLLKH